MVNEKPQTERLGIARLEILFSEIGWLFREQTIHDYGIDCQVEIVEEGKATGKLIAIQVKSGESYFRERTKDAIVFRTDDRHAEYWMSHALPVVVVLYDPKTDVLLWQQLTDQTIEQLEKGWKVEIPEANKLTNETAARLADLTQPPPYVRNLNQLRLDRFWIDLVNDGENVYVEFEDWINKSLPRFQVRIGCDSRKGVGEESWPMLYGGPGSFEDLLETLMPWAEFEMDWDAYHDFMMQNWENEHYMGYDKEADETYYSEERPGSFEPPEDGFAPISENGEVAGYRLIVSLNEIGKAFLTLDDYLSERDAEKSKFSRTE